MLAHFVEDASAVTQDNGNAGDGIPDDVSKPAQPGEVDGDRVPVGVKGRVIGCADGDEALGGLRDGAGVGDVELKSCAGSERSSERDGSFVKLAGVIDVGVERSDGESDVVAGEANGFPIER